jgi:hypothetical protein
MCSQIEYYAGYPHTVCTFSSPNEWAEFFPHEEEPEPEEEG